MPILKYVRIKCAMCNDFPLPGVPLYTSIIISILYKKQGRENNIPYPEAAASLCAVGLLADNLKEADNLLNDPFQAEDRKTCADNSSTSNGSLCSKVGKI